MTEFPGNSHASKIVRLPIPDDEEKKTEEKEEPLHKIAEGRAIVRNKTLGERFKNVFTSGSGSIVDHLIEQIIVPTITATVREMIMTIVAQVGHGIQQSVEYRMGGPNRSPAGSYRPNAYRNGPISYNRYANGGGMSEFAARHRDTLPPYQPRRSNVVKDVILPTREEAEEILGELEGVIERHGHCTVGDLYSIVNFPTTSTDEYWGWVDLRRAYTSAERDGYLLRLPRPQDLGPRR